MYNLQLLTILEKVFGKSYQLKNGENAFYCPFCNHHKKKMQVNLETQKWHCWVSNRGGHSLYSLFKRINADSKYFSELRDIVFIPTEKGEKESKVIVSLPREYQSLSSKSKSLFQSTQTEYPYVLDG